MQYVQTMKEALSIAIENHCIVWADAEGTIFDTEAMLAFIEIEETHSLPKDHYIAVSIEGAIGIVNRYEFDIEWLFYPVLDEAVKQKYISAFNQKIKQTEHKTKKFCTYCGNQLTPNSKFCTGCGASV